MTRLLSLACALLALAVPAGALAAPAAVDVRVEGRTQTIFDGPVTTDAKEVTTASGGTHTCDGTNGGANSDPGPTPTTALDDASIKGGFTWDGGYSAGFDDFFVTRVGRDPQTDSEFWGVFVNNDPLQVGGCQLRLDAGDEVLWTFDAFSKKGILVTRGPDATATNRPVDIRVLDNKTGVPQSGARIGGVTTAADGVARLTFPTPGVYRLKAEKAAYVRSRAHTVCVDPPLVEACTSTDRAAPSVRLDAPALASDASRFGRIPLSWQGDDGTTGSGVRRYRVEVRRADRNGPWRPLATDVPTTKLRVRGGREAAYDFRVRAFDRAGNASRPASASTLVPVDDLSSRLRFSEGWRTLKRQGAYQLTTSRSTEEGAVARFRFAGTRVALVTRKLKFGGRMRVTVDGRSETLNLRGRSRFRRVVFRSRRLRDRRHRLRVVALDDRPVEVDAIAVRP
jgi:hypothetical protein